MADRSSTGPDALQVGGLVAQPRGYDLDTLRGMGARVEDARSVVVSLDRIIEAARPRGDATHVTAISSDGSYRASIPLPDATALGEVHAEEADGGPVLRLQVPGGMTLCWNVKGLALLRVTAGPEPDSLPEVLTH